MTATPRAAAPGSPLSGPAALRVDKRAGGLYHFSFRRRAGNYLSGIQEQTVTFDYVGILLRWLHILSAIALVGGTIYARLALLPAAAVLPEGHRKTLQEGLRQRWMKLVMAAAGLLILSGLLNFVRIIKGLDVDIKPFYHAMFGTKFVLALLVFFLASVLAGRSAAFEKMRQNARFWLTLTMILAIVLVCISGVLRITRDNAAKPEAVAQAQPRESLPEDQALQPAPLSLPCSLLFAGRLSEPLR